MPLKFFSALAKPRNAPKILSITANTIPAVPNVAPTVAARIPFIPTLTAAPMPLKPFMMPLVALTPILRNAFVILGTKLDNVLTTSVILIWKVPKYVASPKNPAPITLAKINI